MMKMIVHPCLWEATGLIPFFGCRIRVPESHLETSSIRAQVVFRQVEPVDPIRGQLGGIGGPAETLVPKWINDPSTLYEGNPNLEKNPRVFQCFFGRT